MDNSGVTEQKGNFMAAQKNPMCKYQCYYNLERNINTPASQNQPFF